MHKQYGVVNQDAVLFEQTDHYTIGVACDGVSLKSDRTFSSSEIASRFCTKAIMIYLRDHLKKNMTEREILMAIYDALWSADDGLRLLLKDLKISLYDCQTTALVFVYAKGRIYAGMAGDGGILYQSKDGEFGILQSRIKTGPNVDPICDHSGWRFGMAGSKGNPVWHVLMATDGVFDALCQPAQDGMALNAEVLEAIFSLSAVRRNYRKKAFREIVEEIPSHDDKSAIVMIDPKNAPVIHKEQKN